MSATEKLPGTGEGPLEWGTGLSSWPTKPNSPLSIHLAGLRDQQPITIRCTCGHVVEGVNGEAREQMREHRIAQHPERPAIAKRPKPAPKKREPTRAELDEGRRLAAAGTRRSRQASARAATRARTGQPISSRPRRYSHSRGEANRKRGLEQRTRKIPETLAREAHAEYVNTGKSSDAIAAQWAHARGYATAKSAARALRQRWRDLDLRVRERGEHRQAPDVVARRAAHLRRMPDRAPDLIVKLVNTGVTRAQLARLVWDLWNYHDHRSAEKSLSVLLAQEPWRSRVQLPDGMTKGAKHWRSAYTPELVRALAAALVETTDTGENEPRYSERDVTTARSAPDLEQGRGEGVSRE